MARVMLVSDGSIAGMVFPPQESGRDGAEDRESGGGDDDNADGPGDDEPGPGLQQGQEFVPGHGERDVGHGVGLPICPIMAPIEIGAALKSLQRFSSSAALCFPF